MYVLYVHECVQNSYMTVTCTFLAERNIRLNAACSGEHVCDDINAACQSGSCQCQLGCYKQQESCGQLLNDYWRCGIVTSML